MVWIALFACQEYAFPGNGDDDTGSTSGTTPGGGGGDLPIANAGSDRTIDPRTEIILDGSDSRDPKDVPIVAWSWEIVSSPSGSAAIISDAAVEKPSVFLDLVGTYVFSLTVQNEDGAWDPTPDRVQVTAEPDDPLYVEATWDGPVDLDLHLLEENGPPFSNGDCTWCNPRPSWGANGPLNDPEMLVDAATGYGPEVVRVSAPEYGTTYRFAVHYYGESGSPTCPNGCPSTVAIVRVYVDGQLVETFARQLEERAQFWTTGEVQWPGAVASIDSVVTVNTTDCSL
jgi:hypothetical protein